MRHQLAEPDLVKALATEPDFSEAFTRKIEFLRDRLSNDLRVTVEHDSDMNYSACQKLILGYEAKGDAVESSSAESKFRLFVYVSSKGPYFAKKLFSLHAVGADHLEHDLPAPGDYWLEATRRDGVPAKIVDSISQLDRWMQAQGYELIDGETADESVEGHRTELDGSPATVFDVLFSEIE